MKESVDCCFISLWFTLLLSLVGNDFKLGDTSSVDVAKQVELLIDQATSHENLCQCYIGWCPFW